MIQPPYLKPGSRVGLAAPAKFVAPEAVAPAVAVLRGWGLRVARGRHLAARHHVFAGTDRQRTADLQRLLDDPDMDAIFCFRGGYGTTRIVDALDWAGFLARPKWLVGYSDITALHLHLHRLGVQSLHATMPLLFARDTEASVLGLKRVLFGEAMRYTVPAHPLNRAGTGTGPLIGGNLSLLASCVGTASDVDTAGKILFIEDIDEPLYHLDRMMVQLRRAGKLAGLAGLVAGHFTALRGTDPPFGLTAYELVRDAVRGYGYPVCFGFPTGHEPENWPLVCGQTATLQVGRTQSRITENAP